MSDLNNDQNTNNKQPDAQTSNYSRPTFSKRTKPKFPWFKTVLVALIAGIIGALIVLGIGKVMENTVLEDNGSTVKEANNNNNAGNSLDGKSDKYDSVNQMITDVSPAIVGVINMQKAQNLDDLLKGKSAKSEEAGVGSGVIYQKIMDPHILLQIIT